MAPMRVPFAASLAMLGLLMTLNGVISSRVLVFATTARTAVVSEMLRGVAGGPRLYLGVV